MTGSACAPTEAMALMSLDRPAAPVGSFELNTNTHAGGADSISKSVGARVCMGWHVAAIRQNVVSLGVGPVKAVLPRYNHSILFESLLHCERYQNLDVPNLWLDL